MRFFEQFEKILLEKQSKSQKSTTLRACPVLESELNEAENAKKCDRKLRPLKPKAPVENAKKRCETVEKEASNPWTPDVVLVEGEESPPTTFESQNSISSSSVNGEVSKKKKRKVASRMSLFKHMMDSLTLKFMKHQADNDDKMLSTIEQLEIERNAMDERIQKMWIDFEEKRIADEREHELQVMKVFQTIIDQVKKNNEV